MNNVHPIFIPILESICPSKKEGNTEQIDHTQIDENQINNSPKSVEEQKWNANLRSFSDWLIAGKPRLH